MDKVTEYILNYKPHSLEPITRRVYLAYKAMEAGSSWWMAVEAVSSTAIEHPDLDMDETKTLEEWESSR